MRVIPLLVCTAGENPDPTRPDFELGRLLSTTGPARLAADLLGRGLAVVVLEPGR